MSHPSAQQDPRNCTLKRRRDPQPKLSRVDTPVVGFVPSAYLHSFCMPIDTYSQALKYKSRMAAVRVERRVQSTGSDARLTCCMGLSSRALVKSAPWILESDRSLLRMVMAMCNLCVLVPQDIKECRSADLMNAMSEQGNADNNQPTV